MFDEGKGQTGGEEREGKIELQPKGRNTEGEERKGKQLKGFKN